MQKIYPSTSIQHLGSDRGDGPRERRQADSYQPYRMSVHLVMENITNASTVLPMLNDPSGGFQSAINYLQSVLSVIRAPHNLFVPPFCAKRNSNGQCTETKARMCGHSTVPAEHLGTIMVCDPTCREVGGTGVDADYVFYVTAVDDGTCIVTSLQLYLI